MKFQISNYIIKTLLLLNVTLLLSSLKFNGLNNIYSIKVFFVKVIIANIVIYVILLIAALILSKISFVSKKRKEFEKEAKKAFNLITQCIDDYPSKEIAPRNNYMYDLEKKLKLTYLDEVDKKKAVEYFEYLEWLEQNIYMVNDSNVKKKLAYFEKYFNELITNNIYK